MRLLMLFSIGFCGSIALCAYLLWNDPVLWAMLAAFSFFLMLACLCIRKRPASAVAVCLLGMVVGSLWYWGYDAIFLSHARQMDQQKSEAVLEVIDYSAQTDYGITTDGKMQLDGRSYRVRFYLYEAVQLKPGDIVEGTFRFRFTSSGAATGAVYYRGEGILLLAYAADSASVTPGDDTNIRYLAARLRRGTLDLIAKIFPADTKAFAQALLIGEDSCLTYEENTALKLSGIRHVVAVSGQHLTTVMAAVLCMTGKRKRLAMWLTLPTVILFSAMTGMSASILRACIMQVIMTLAFLRRQEFDGPTALGASMLGIIAINPLAITSVSLQLSAGCIAGMILFSEKLYTRMRRWYFFKKLKNRTPGAKAINWILQTASVTLASMVITVPLSAVYFRTMSIVSILTNLLTLWLITLVFYVVIAAVALGAMWLPLGSALGAALSVPIRFVLAIARQLASVPGGCLFLRNSAMILTCCVVYGVLLICLGNRRARVWRAFCAATLALCLGFTASWMAPLQDPYRITLLDVGQGQCVILQSGQRTYMVDCGGSNDKITADTAAETLLSMGIERVDGLILTHFDEDHVGGAKLLLTRIQADSLILPEDPGYPDATALAEMCSGTVIIASQDLYTAWGDSKLTVFAGNGGDFGNEMSLCVLFQSGDCDILITGDRPADREMDLLRHTPLPKLEYLIAGHHGANSATGYGLLAATQPETVLISVGADNRYGHPAPELIARLEQFGCKVRRTDLEGTIIIRG